MSLALDMARARVPASDDTSRNEYLQSLRLIERLHRLLLDVIKDEYDRLGGAELNSVQALLLYNMGDSELTAGELKTRGYYLGSNVSYNLKKLVDMGYLHYKRSDKDRRSVRVSMGTVLQIPWTRLEEWPRGADQLHAAGFVVAALALDDGAVDLAEFASHPPDRVALLLGTEGDGLSRPALDAADTVVTIPMSRGVDSLNVAAASAVALWALRR